MGINEIRLLKSQPKIPKELRQKKPLAKKSAKKIAQEKEEKAAKVDGGNELGAWFRERRREMTGRCLFCGGKTEKRDNERFGFSVAHLLPKRKNMFPSVATHKDNWLELCYYGNSCHTNFDNGQISLELLRDSAEWPIIVEKFKSIYPFIAESEKKNIPIILLKEL